MLHTLSTTKILKEHKTTDGDGTSAKTYHCFQFDNHYAKCRCEANG